MSWQDFYQRRDALDAAIAHAGRTGGRELGYHELPQARAVFGGEAELLTAMHHKWNLLLTGRLEVAAMEAEQDPRADATDAVTRAWRGAARQAPALRAALDAHADHPALREQLAVEHGMLAHLAGLTDAGDTEQDAARIGGTFVGLVRTGDRLCPSRRVGQRVLRKLSAALSA